jgi:hypothetical protein
MFLGHVDCIGSQLDLQKIIVVTNFCIPKIITNVKVFLGLTRYYRKFIVGYVKIIEHFFA